MQGSDYWPHAPRHILSHAGTYMVTAGTYHKAAYFASNHELDALQAGLFKYAKMYSWDLEAWAVFPNHYHFIGHSPDEGAGNLRAFLSEFHRRSARWLNLQHGCRDRQVWHNFWETRISFRGSYFARLHYVHQNPVKHGIVADSRAYRWCSAKWLEDVATASTIRAIYAAKCDKVNVADDY